MTVFDHALAVADAVLYEGYVLYPYRRSSPKNEVRWQFGVLLPRCWVEPRGPVVDGVAGSTEWWWQQTECLLEAPDTATLRVRVRFLQQQAKRLQAVTQEGTFRVVDRLDCDDRLEVGFDEAVPRETELAVGVGELSRGDRTVEVDVPGGEDVEPVADAHGQVIGRVLRTRGRVSGLLRLRLDPVDAPFPARRLRIRLESTEGAPDPDRSRQEALSHALIAAHTLVAVDTGSFLSLMDPPQWASAAAASCRNVRTFPVLAGADGADDLVLSSPIILYDHPQIAPESPGDLHDACEIDEILSLRTLLLTDEEKREARATDPRAAAIVDRVDAMPPEVMERLHGAVRSLRAGGPSAAEQSPPPATPWWDPGADASVDPASDAVVVDGARVCRGSRVRLVPRRRGTDAHDMFLGGRTAVVEAVLHDVDGSIHVAVTIEDDPSAELHQWYGRYHYYRPEELAPLDDAGTGERG